MTDVPELRGKLTDRELMIAGFAYRCAQHGDDLERMETLIREKFDGHPESCTFNIGQRVYWQGQIGECSGVIIEITRPENSGYVLKVDIGDGAEMYQLESEVSPSAAQGTPEPPTRAGFEAVCRERDLLRGDLYDLREVVTADNFAEMQKRAETAEQALAALAGPQNGQGWVFVESGKLPKSRTWVNVCTEHDRQRQVTPAFGVRDEYERWRWECEFKVIAWQPLPAPPTGDAPPEKKL